MFQIFALNLLILILTYNSHAASDRLSEIAVKELKLEDLVGIWPAKYTKSNGLNCFGIDFLQNTTKQWTKLQIWNSNKNKDVFTVTQEDPTRQGILTRNFRIGTQTRKFPVYVLDTDSKSYLVLYHVVNSDSSKDFWTIYSKQTDNYDDGAPINATLLEKSKTILSSVIDANKFHLNEVTHVNCTDRYAPGGFIDLFSGNKDVN